MVIRLMRCLGRLPHHNLSNLSFACARRLTLHAYQSQSLLKENGVPVPRSAIIKDVGELKNVVDLTGKDYIMKAQLLQGRFGEAQFSTGLRGDTHVIRSADKGTDIASKMLGSRVKSTAPYEEIFAVNRVSMTEMLTGWENWYLAITVDRETYSPALIMSKLGDVDIRTVAESSPTKLTSFRISFSEGITTELLAQLRTEMGISPDEVQKFDNVLRKLYKLFTEKDATLLEINPLVQTQDGSFICANSTLVLDDAASNRQPQVFALRDKSQEVGAEVEAENYKLVYIKMGGNIGTIVNGAGLAMATNDAIGLHGGSSANFLDAGGQATKETMQQAFGIVLRDERVKSILVNIYGGITRCDMIAESIIGAAQEMELSVPIVVRLQGTNSEEGLRLLADTDLGLHVEADFGRAAQRAVELAK